MNIVYLDQFVPSNLRKIANGEGSHSYIELREVIDSLVARGIAIFPYSDIHIAETEKTPDDTRNCYGTFWDSVSRGYRFFEPKHIASQQALQLLEGRRQRFAGHLVLSRHPIANFVHNLGQHRPKYHEMRASGLREVVKYWETLDAQEMPDKIAAAEAQAGGKLYQELLHRMQIGDFSAEEFNLPHVELASRVLEYYNSLELGAESIIKTIQFLATKTLEIPSIALDSYATGILAQRYGQGTRIRSSAEKSELDHDSYDFSAIANFMPYCDIGLFDKKAVGIFKSVSQKEEFRDLKMNIFSSKDINIFIEKLKQLPSPENRAIAQREIESTEGRALVIIPEKGQELVQREELPMEDNCKRQILPYGGIKVSSTNLDWSILFSALKSTLSEFAAECQGEATISAGLCSSVLFESRIPFGFLELCDDLEGKIQSL